MINQKNSLHSSVIFCRVVDNYGDIGICWRLARQLRHEHNLDLTLWVDDLLSFRRICPEIDVELEQQQASDVVIRHWRDQADQFCVDDIADIVIEFFGCDLPPGYLSAMAQCIPPPIWLNLEGLSAEDWVEGCHTLPSPHGQFSLTKHFFFPGFSSKTGGLLCESSLLLRRAQFQSDPATAAAFLADFGMTPSEIASFKVSLFCYPNAPITALFDAWEHADMPLTCLVPEGVAVPIIEAFLGSAASAGSKCRRGALTVLVLPFIAQPLYDQLLWACDLNFVRGEDSFVRAQWAGKPFIWHIYPQDKNLHHVKLAAFLHRYRTRPDAITQFFERWNGVPLCEETHAINWPLLWSNYLTATREDALHSVKWQQHISAIGDLASNMMQFARTLRLDAKK